MNIADVLSKINLVEQNLEEIRKITSVVTAKKLGIGIDGTPQIEGSEDMSKKLPIKNSQLQKLWKQIQKNVPPGFSLDGNLIRHISFNQARDWFDIWSYDIPRELIEISEYKKQLSLVEYLNTLHPEISRVSGIVLSGDIDAALKTVYASLESKIRSHLKLKATESTIPALGKAFKNGVLRSPIHEYSDAARNFLQGVIGYYRSNIIHNPITPTRNSIGASLSLFGLADESFRLFEECIQAEDIPF